MDIKEQIREMYKGHKDFCNDQHGKDTHPGDDEIDCFISWVREQIETPKPECPDCEKGEMNESDVDGELIMQCSACGFWMDIDVWKDGQH